MLDIAIMRSARMAHYDTPLFRGKRIIVLFDDCDLLFGLVTSAMLATYFMAKVLYVNGAPWLMDTHRDSCERADAIIVFTPTDGKVCHDDFATMLGTVCGDERLLSKTYVFTHQNCQELPQLSKVTQRVPVDHPYGWVRLAHHLAN